MAGHLPNGITQADIDAHMDGPDGGICEWCGCPCQELFVAGPTDIFACDTCCDEIASDNSQFGMGA
jgi:hypothetical protein